MKRLSYPSGDLPGPPRVSLDVPKGWLVEPAPGAVLVAASPDSVGGVHSNAVVTIRRVAARVTVDQLDEYIDERFSEAAEVSLVRRERIYAGGEEIAVRTYELLDPDDGTRVQQMQAICLVPLGKHIADAVTLTVTHGMGIGAEELAKLRDVIASLRVDPNGAGAVPDRT